MGPQVVHVPAMGEVVAEHCVAPQEEVLVAVCERLNVRHGKGEDVDLLAAGAAGHGVLQLLHALSDAVPPPALSGVVRLLPHSRQRLCRSPALEVRPIFQAEKWK